MKLIYYFEIRIYLILGTCLPYFSGLFHLFDPQNVLVAWPIIYSCCHWQMSQCVPQQVRIKTSLHNHPPLNLLSSSMPYCSLNSHLHLYPCLIQLESCLFVSCWCEDVVLRFCFSYFSFLLMFPNIRDQILIWCDYLCCHQLTIKTRLSR